MACRKPGSVTGSRLEIHGGNVWNAMENVTALKDEIKKLLVDNLMLQITSESIRDDQALFGPEGLGLDSVDALQLVVALDKQYGLKIPDPAAAQVILRSVSTIAEAIQARRDGQPVTPRTTS